MGEQAGTDPDDPSAPRVSAHEQAIHLRARMKALATSIAETEEHVAEAYEDSARLRPHAAERLTEAARQAREYADRERRFGDDDAADTPDDLEEPTARAHRPAGP